ncbi:hypothetical protein ACHAQA_005194 [Verticillium albo-atrum]
MGHLPSKPGGTFVPAPAHSPNPARPARLARSVRSSRSRSSEIGSPMPAAAKLCSIPERQESPRKVTRKPIEANPVAEPTAIIVTPLVTSPKTPATPEKQADTAKIHDIEEDPVSAV